MDNQTLDGLALRGLNSIFNSYGYYGYRRSEKKERVKSLLERPELFSYFDTLEYEMTLTGIADILKELSEQSHVFTHAVFMSGTRIWPNRIDSLPN